MSTLDPKLRSKLEALEERSRELSALLAQPDVTSDMERYTQLSRSYAELTTVVEKFNAYNKKSADLDGAREMLAEADDAEMKAMATEEIQQAAPLVPIYGFGVYTLFFLVPLTLRARRRPRRARDL